MIRVITINVDGAEVEHTWDTITDLKDDWLSGEFSGPSLDDKVVSATVEGEKVSCDDFDDFIWYLSKLYRFKY